MNSRRNSSEGVRELHPGSDRQAQSPDVMRQQFEGIVPGSDRTPAQDDVIRNQAEQRRESAQTLRPNSSALSQRRWWNRVSPRGDRELGEQPPQSDTGTKREEADQSIDVGVKLAKERFESYVENRRNELEKRLDEVIPQYVSRQKRTGQSESMRKDRQDRYLDSLGHLENRYMIDVGQQYNVYEIDLRQLQEKNSNASGEEKNKLAEHRKQVRTGYEERSTEEQQWCKKTINDRRVRNEEPSLVYSETGHSELRYIPTQELSSQHREITESIRHLAQLREAEGNHVEARTLYTRVLAMREQEFGPDHPRTTEARTHLNTLLSTMGQHGEPQPPEQPDGALPPYREAE